MNNLGGIWGFDGGNGTGDSTEQLFPSRRISGASYVGDGPFLDAFPFSALDLAEGPLDGLSIQWVQSQVNHLYTLPQTDANSLQALAESSGAKAEHSSGQGSQSKFVELYNSEDFSTENGKPGGPRKRQRATEVHNLTEKKRRERINERIKTLHNLVPSSHKCDKVSMLDDVIEHIKSLQHQAQILSQWRRVQTPHLFSPEAVEHTRQLPQHISGIRNPAHEGMCCFGHGLHDMSCHCCDPFLITQPQPLVSSAPALEFSPLQMPIPGSTHASAISFNVEALAPSFVIPSEASNQALAPRLPVGISFIDETK